MMKFTGETSFRSNEQSQEKITSRLIEQRTTARGFKISNSEQVSGANSPRKLTGIQQDFLKRRKLHAMRNLSDPLNQTFDSRFTQRLSMNGPLD
jgi:hypothetical protein